MTVPEPLDRSNDTTPAFENVIDPSADTLIDTCLTAAEGALLELKSPQEAGQEMARAYDIARALESVWLHVFTCLDPADRPRRALAGRINATAIGIPPSSARALALGTLAGAIAEARQISRQVGRSQNLIIIEERLYQATDLAWEAATALAGAVHAQRGQEAA
jgi:hypothetical protein